MDDLLLCDQHCGPH